MSNDPKQEGDNEAKMSTDAKLQEGANEEGERDIPLPPETEVNEAKDLEPEFARLGDILKDITSAPSWKWREWGLIRIAKFCQGPQSRFSNFVDLLDKHKAGVTAQLADRRSAIVKEACNTITAISLSLRERVLANLTLYQANISPTSTLVPSTASATVTATPTPIPAPTIPQPSASSPATNAVDGKTASSSSGQTAVLSKEALKELFDKLNKERSQFATITVFLIQQLLPILPVTIKVISNSANVCLTAVLKNISGVLAIEDGFMVMKELAVGAIHKHNVVRHKCYQGFAMLMAKLPTDVKEIDSESKKEENKENKKDETKKEKKELRSFKNVKAMKNSDESQKEKKDETTATTASTSEGTNATSTTSASASSTSTSASTTINEDKGEEKKTEATIAPEEASKREALLPFFEFLEQTIGKGLKDSDEKARVSARQCLIELRDISKLRSERLIKSMTSSAQKLFNVQLQEHLKTVGAYLFIN